MRMTFIILFHLFFIQNIFSQCDCEKIHRADGTITECKPLPVGGDKNLQLGLSLASNGKDNFITLTIRYISGQPFKITGDLSLRLIDNNLLTFNLVNTLSSYIGNSEVENGIFFITKTQFDKIKNAKMLTISIKLSDSRMHTVEAIFNQDVLMNQSKCLIEAQSGWIEKKSEIGNFYLSFPNIPTYSSETGWYAKDKNDQVTYFISYKEVPSNNEMTIAVVEKYLLPSMLKGDIQVSKNYLTYSGSNAIDFLYKTTQTPVMYKKGRVIVRPHKLYILQVYYYHSELADFDKFSKSLKFY